MTGSSVCWLVFPILVAVATGVSAQNKCIAKGQMGGQAFSLTHCEVAYYEGSHGITIWFSSTPIIPAERDFFQTSSSVDRFRKGRSMVHVAFCPGGGSAVPSPKTAKSVEIGFAHATVLSLGTQDQWVLDPVSDKQIKIELLTGELKRGGQLSGKITGAIAGHKPAFSWDLQFDLVLPQRAAAAGPSC
ncbi:MAG: hypothetical protein H0T80_12555 [Betaproteobacteria bacterium]|nr:hypothetical protein [Betaproteobacteria bacterium]